MLNEGTEDTNGQRQYVTPDELIELAKQEALKYTGLQTLEELEELIDKTFDTFGPILAKIIARIRRGCCGAVVDAYKQLSGGAEPDANFARNYMVAALSLFVIPNHPTQSNRTTDSFTRLLRHLS